MEFKEAMRTWARLCDVSNCDKGCNGCPMYDYCNAGVCRFPNEVEATLAKWAEEHPEKTIADDFFEKHPKAPRDDANNPYPCAKDCGYSKPPYCERTPINCDNCWRRPLEEVEG